MGSLPVGFHVEGWDHLILISYLAKLLSVEETEIEPDVIERDNRGDTSIPVLAQKALKRFYGKCARCAVLGIDNDGNLDLTNSGEPEDPTHPRHFNHIGKTNGRCRYCRLEDAVKRTRPELTWLPAKPGATWPVLIAVPVEMIEAWLLTSRAIVDLGDGTRFQAEQLPRSVLKQRLYGKPAATKDDVDGIALPLVRKMSGDHLEALASHSKSFELFKEQVSTQRERILDSRSCWSLGSKTQAAD